jgi:type IV secretion system protein VirD4
MILYTLMNEYIRQSISQYDNNARNESKDLNDFVSYFEDYTSGEMLLRNYGWKPIKAHFRFKELGGKNTHNVAYYNEEYRSRIDLYFDVDDPRRFFIDWHTDLVRGLPSYYIDSNYKNAFSLYCILKYGGNIKAALYHFIVQNNRHRDWKKFLFDVDVDKKCLEYTPPPPPIGADKLFEQIQANDNQEKFSELENKITKLSQQIGLVQKLVHYPPTAYSLPQAQITASQTTNQFDGNYNQEYSQARYTSFKECENYSTNTGIPIGYYADTNPFQPNCTDNKIYYQGETHLITIAPTGSGKNTSVQIPTLMEYKGSMVVIDPKGECAIISARQRQRLGHRVIIINPFDILKKEFEAIGITEFDGFNPLAFLNPDDDNFVADVSALAESLVVGEDIGNSDPYWSNSARDLIACIIMYVCVCDDEKENKHLARVRQILTSEQKEFLVWIQKISKHTGHSISLTMAQKANRFLSSDKSNLSVISTAIANTLFIDDPKISASLKSTNNFSFKQLKEEKITVYIILPAKFLLAYSRWFRLLVTSALDTMMSTHEKSDKSVLFMLDEFPILGHMSSIETAIGLARGYEIQLWIFLQDIHQLKHLYKDKAESFLANTGVQQYFVPNDLKTAEKISKRMGNTTLVDNRITSDTVTNAYGQIVPNAAVKMEFTHKERPLLYPIEVMALHKDKQIVFFSGNVNPILMNKNHYYVKDENGKPLRYLDKDGKPMYDENPYHKAKK